MAKDYYSILGIRKDASADDIKRAFHRLAHKYHPDKGGDEAKFKEINEAYQVLSDRDKRSQYDQFGRVFEGAGQPGGQGPGPGWDFTWQWGQGSPGESNEETNFDFGNLGDIFEEFMGFGGNRPQKKRDSKRGRDLEVGVEIELKDTLANQERQISLEKFIRCDRCAGSGSEPGSPIKECFTCRGTGEVQQVRRTILGNITSFVVCPECKGEGQRPEKSCNVCKGEGRIRGIKLVNVFIPAGVDQNQVIKMEGEGDSGKKGGRAGDLYVRIIVKTHPVFDRKGDDLFMALGLPFSKLVLGGEVPIHDLAGKRIIVSIPPGSEPGKMLRLSGKGIPHFRGRGQGNLYLELKIKMPHKLNPKQKELLEKLEEEEI